jgi:hypothetical protein
MQPRKTLFILSLISSFILSSPVLALQSGDFTYKVSNNTVTITRYTGADDEVVIPSDIAGMPVVGIQEGAFSYRTLTSLIIPDSVTNIGGFLFEGCSQLTSINVDTKNTVYSSQNGVLYNKDNTILICYPTGVSGDINIPDGVTSIGSYAFAYCSKLTSVTIPDGVTTIGTSAFAYCSELTNVTIPDGVTSIGTGAFFVTALTSLTIPGSVTSLSPWLFSVPAGWEFANHTLTNVTIMDGVTSIGGHAFANCYALTAAYFYGNAPTLGEGVFASRASGFTVYYLAGATGFTSPSWYGYPAAEFTDVDSDGFPDTTDNCPNTYNPLQLDADHDGIGDSCDPTPGCGGCGLPLCDGQAATDTDNDFWADPIDNCPSVYNPNKLDADGDHIGDCCDPEPGCGGCGQPACDTVCAP